MNDNQFGDPLPFMIMYSNHYTDSTLLDSSCLTTEKKKYDFDFLINDKLIRGTLEDHVTQHHVPTEQVITIQCIQHSAPPELSQEIEHKDWVSAVHCCQL